MRQQVRRRNGSADGAERCANVREFDNLARRCSRHAARRIVRRRFGSFSRATIRLTEAIKLGGGGESNSFPNLATPTPIRSRLSKMTSSRHGWTCHTTSRPPGSHSSGNTARPSSCGIADCYAERVRHRTIPGYSIGRSGRFFCPARGAAGDRSRAPIPAGKTIRQRRARRPAADRLYIDNGGPNRCAARCARGSVVERGVRCRRLYGAFRADILPREQTRSMSATTSSNGHRATRGLSYGSPTRTRDGEILKGAVLLGRRARRTVIFQALVGAG